MFGSGGFLTVEVAIASRNTTHPASPERIHSRPSPTPVRNRTAALDASSSVSTSRAATCAVTHRRTRWWSSTGNRRARRGLAAEAPPAYRGRGAGHRRDGYMYELAEVKDALIHVLGSLPDETKLVQVTGDERPEPLSRVAKRHGAPTARTRWRRPRPRPAGRRQRRAGGVRLHRYNRGEGLAGPLDRKGRVVRRPLHPAHPRRSPEASARNRVRARRCRSGVRA